MIREDILFFLDEKKEESYKQFSLKLIPGENHAFGVRIPILRQYAKQIKKQDEIDDLYKIYLSDKVIEDTNLLYHEEKLLLAISIGLDQRRFLDKKEILYKFFPLISNWSVCDSLCSSLKPRKEEYNEWFEFLQECISTNVTYVTRFGIVMLLEYFIEKENLQEIFASQQAVSNSDYYVNMAIAWNLSMCYVKYPTETFDYLKQSTFSSDILQKTIQKVRDSRQVSIEEKNKVLLLKR